MARAVSTRTSVQVLLGVLLRAEDGEVHLAATDMELSLRASLDADVQDEGAVVVPGRLLVELVPLLPVGEVTIEHRPRRGSSASSAARRATRLHSYSVEDFPRLPEVDAAPALHAVDRGACSDTVRASRVLPPATSRARC